MGEREIEGRWGRGSGGGREGGAAGRSPTRAPPQTALPNKTALLAASTAMLPNKTALVAGKVAALEVMGATSTVWVQI